MHAAALALLLLAGQLQEKKDYKEFTISRQQLSSYKPALKEFQEAEKLQADPLECVKRCGDLLKKESIHPDHWDSMIRLMNTDGSYGEWSLFAPYQLRGCAHLSLATTLAKSDRREALKEARLALADLHESVRRGLKSSEAPLEQAKQLSLKLDDERAAEAKRAEADRLMQELRKLVEQKSTPESVLERCRSVEAEVQGTPYEIEFDRIRTAALEVRWKGHADAGRFRSARATRSA